MTTQKRKNDDELPVLAILGGIFTIVLICMDIWYSSINLLSVALQTSMWAAQMLLAAVWVLVFAKWKDPNYDKYRYVAFWLSVLLMLVVGIHHAVDGREAEQIIIDSKENAAKP